MSAPKKQIDNAKQCVAYIKAVLPHVEDGALGGGKKANLKVTLKDAGFEVLGGGHYSFVVTHVSMPDLVIKVCAHREADKESGITYLAWARANPGPHVPKVYHLERVTGAWFAVINRLRPMGYDNSAIFARCMNAGWGDEREYDKDSEYAVCRVAHEIKEFFRGICGWDLHDENVMEDDDGNMVITDPITETKDNESRLLRDGMERAYSVEKSA